MEKIASITIGQVIMIDNDSYYSSKTIGYIPNSADTNQEDIGKQIDNYVTSVDTTLPMITGAGDDSDFVFDFDKIDKYVEVVSEIADIIEIPYNGVCLDDDGTQYLFPVDRTEFKLEDFFVEVNEESYVTVNALYAYYSSFSDVISIYKSENSFFALVVEENGSHIHSLSIDASLDTLTIEDVIEEDFIEDFEPLEETFDSRFSLFCETNNLDESDFVKYDEDAFRKVFVWVD